MKIPAILVLLVSLLACGGGGGGGGSQNLAINLNPARLDFVTLSGASTAPESIDASLSGATSTVYLGWSTDLPNTFTASLTITSGTTATISFGLASGFVPTPGLTSGTITLRAYSDYEGTHPIYAKDIPVSLRAFAVGGSPVSLSAVEGQPSVAGSLTLTPADPDGQVTVTRASGAWLSAARADAATYAVTAQTASLSSGSYQGVLNVVTRDATLTVPVGLQVGTGILVAPSQTLTLDGSSTAGSLQGSVPIAFYQGQSRAWTAASDQSWLVLGSTSGTGDTSLPFSLDPAGLAALPNNATATATIRLTAAGMTATQTQVALQKALPEVHMVQPPVVAPGVSTQVKLLGRGFSRLSGAGAFGFGGVASLSASVLSDSQAIVQVDALAAGRRAITAGALASMAPAGPDLRVANPPALSYAYVPSTGSIRSALYDPTRQAVYAANFTQDGLMRVQWDGSQWQSAALPVTTIGDLGMAPDRRRLYVTSGTNTLLAVDPDTLQVAATYTNTSIDLSYADYYTNGLQATHNNRIWFPKSQWVSPSYFDVGTGRFGVWNGLPGNPNLLYSPRYSASGDGSKLLMTSAPGITTASQGLYLAGSDSAATAPGLPAVHNGAALSGDGSRALVDGVDVYDTATWLLLGHAQDGASRYGYTALLSPDGTRAYCCVFQSSTSTDIVRIDVFDTTTLAAGTTNFVKLGSIPVTDLATACPGNPYACQTMPTFFLSPQGDTLFLYGNLGLIVVPVPGALAGQTPFGSLARVAARP